MMLKRIKAIGTRIKNLAAVLLCRIWSITKKAGILIGHLAVSSARRVRDRIGKLSPIMMFLFIILLIYSILLISMLGWAVIQSFKDPWEFDDSAIKFPVKFLFENYKIAAKSYEYPVKSMAGTKMVGVGGLIWNTILYAVGCSFMATFVPCCTAYIVSKFKYKILNIYNVIVIICMALPIVGSLPSELHMAQMLGLYDHVWGLWLMKGYFLGMYYFVFYAAFKTIPDSFSESAQIDGANNFQIMFRIMMPLVATTFTTVMLIQFITYWNDYQTARIYMPHVPTLSMGLLRFAFSSNDEFSTPPIQLAGCMLLMIPILIMYITLQKKLIGSLTMGGIKE